MGSKGTILTDREKWPDLLTAAIAAAAAASLPWFFPQTELAVFARVSAVIAGALSGSPVLPVEDGWMLPSGSLPVVVTRDCSATDYFALAAALIAWRLARRERSRPRKNGVPAPWIRRVAPFLQITFSSLGLAFGFAVFTNALRVIVVAQAHRWVIPRLPDVYGGFAHMLTGLAVFLPCLIAINVLLDSDRRARLRADASRA